MKSIEFYTTANGKKPCQVWLDSLEKSSRRKILAYITRFAAGGATRNLRALGGGVFEIKVDYGPGFRVYFAEVENVLILLLVGGDKRTQFLDIQKAKHYWRTYEKK
ncbi:type II toxin-antitoxin system RelE/ParE family toxin [Bdellovibrionota bacterium FG-2]